MSAYQNKFIERKESKIRTDFFKHFEEITFPNFVKFFVEHAIKKQVDHHWRRYFSRCGYCIIPFKVIAKMETMGEDMKYIGEMVGGGKFKKNVRGNTSGGGSTSQLTRDYFSKLDKHLVHQLYLFYQIDFEMFGYKPDKFL